MPSRSDTKRMAAATTKLGRTIAEAMRSWVQEVKLDEIASDVMDRVREGFDVVFDAAKEAADKAPHQGKEPYQEGQEEDSEEGSSTAKRKTNPQDLNQEEGGAHQGVVI